MYYDGDLCLPYVIQEAELSVRSKQEVEIENGEKCEEFDGKTEDTSDKVILYTGFASVFAGSQRGY